MAKDQRGHYPDWNEAMGRAAVRLMNLEESLPPGKRLQQSPTEHLRIVELWIAFAQELREAQASVPFPAQPPFPAQLPVQDQPPFQAQAQAPVQAQPPMQDWVQPPMQDQPPVQDWPGPR